MENEFALRKLTFNRWSADPVLGPELIQLQQRLIHDLLEFSTKSSVCPNPAVAMIIGSILEAAINADQGKNFLETDEIFAFLGKTEFLSKRTKDERIQDAFLTLRKAAEYLAR